MSNSLIQKHIKAYRNSRKRFLITGIVILSLTAFLLGILFYSQIGYGYKDVNRYFRLDDSQPKVVKI